MFFKRSTQVSNDNAPSTGAAAASASLIAADTAIDGNVTTGGEIHIDGTLRGSVEAALCVVGPEGMVEGTVAAAEVIVRGRVAGPIRGVHVELQAGAHVEGDVINTTIAVQSGAHIQGAIWHSDDPLGTGEGDAGGGDQQPARSGLFANPLWSSPGDDRFMPLRAVKPR